MWKPYSSYRDYLPDFTVSYQFFKTEDGGRKSPPFQGYRCDFSYDGDDVAKVGIFMIHPEFLDNQKAVILIDNEPVAMSGYANMWILLPDMRSKVHVNRIKEGTVGYFMEGSRRVARVEVVELLGIFENLRRGET